MPFYLGRTQGMLLRKRAREQANQRDPHARVGRSAMRLNCTYVAVIANDVAVQAHLPQFIIINERFCKLEELGELRATLPPNFVLLREKSAWNNVDVMTLIVRELGRACREYAPGRARVLLLDAVRLHFHERVFVALVRNGFSAILIPASMTWLLQPLDTHCFSLFKRTLKKLYVDGILLRRHPLLAVADWLDCLVRTITQVILGRDWSHAFSRDGFAVGQNFVSDRVISNLGLDEVPFLEPRALSADEHALLLPRRTKVFGYMLTAAAPRVATDLALPPPPLPPPLEPPPTWFGRTRSTSRLALPPETPEESEAPAPHAGPAASAASASAGGATSSGETPDAEPIALRTRSRSRG